MSLQNTGRGESRSIASSRASTTTPALSLGCRFQFTWRRMEEKPLRSGRAKSTLALKLTAPPIIALVHDHHLGPIDAW